MLTHVHRTIIVATISALPLHPVLSIVPLFHGYSLKFSEHNRAIRRSFLQHSLPSVFFYIRNYCTTHASNLTLRIKPSFLFFLSLFHESLSYRGTMVLSMSFQRVAKNYLQIKKVDSFILEEK